MGENDKINDNKRNKEPAHPDPKKVKNQDMRVFRSLRSLVPAASITDSARLRSPLMSAFGTTNSRLVRNFFIILLTDAFLVVHES